MKTLSHSKALVFDLDGTLLRPDKTISERTLKALGACMEKGIQIILATGRGIQSTEPYRLAIGTTGPQVYYNGAEVADMPSGKIIHAQLLGIEPALFCLELARQRQFYYQVYFPKGGLSPDEDKEILLAEKLGAEAEYYLKHSGLLPRSGNLETALCTPHLSGIIKAMFITKEEDQEGIRKAITERFGDSVTVVRSSPTYLEVLAKDVSKGMGLIQALNYVNIAPEDTIAFGDEENDLPMFAIAGFSAAPANSVKAVLEAASFRIPSNADDGIACFLEERIL